MNQAPHPEKTSIWSRVWRLPHSRWRLGIPLGGVLELLEDINSKGTTIVMVTHDEHMARKTHRLVRLFDGARVQ